MTHATLRATRIALPHTQQRGHTADLLPFGQHLMRRVGVSGHLSTGAPHAPLAGSAHLAGPAGVPGRSTAGTARHATLGSALAGSMWAWAPPALHPACPVATQQEHVAPTAGAAIPAVRGRGEAGAQATSPVELSMPSALLRAMAAAAANAGRRECDVWAEAAREWLLRHSQDDDPLPPPPAAAAPDPTAPRSARERCWTAIDILLNDLRSASRHHHHPASPAARGGLPCYPAA